MLSNSGINKVLLLGQVTTTPQISAANGNDKFLYFTLVTVELLKKGNDNVEHNEFHNVKIPQKMVDAENLGLEVGQSIYIEGKLSTTAYVDNRRVKRYNLEIIAHKVEILKNIPVVTL